MPFRSGLVAIVCLLCLWSPASYAADDGFGFEVTPVAGFRFGGTFNIQGTSDAYEIKDSSSAGLILNLRDKPQTQWELLYSRHDTTAELNSTAALQAFVDVTIDVLQIGGTYNGTRGSVRPYVAVTLGGTRIRADSGSDNFFSGSIGVGLRLLPESRIGIRVEARAYGTFTDSDTDLFCQTGPIQNICAVRVDGDLLSQVELFAGVVFRF